MVVGELPRLLFRCFFVRTHKFNPVHNVPIRPKQIGLYPSIAAPGTRQRRNTLQWFLMSGTGKIAKAGRRKSRLSQVVPLQQRRLDFGIAKPTSRLMTISKFQHCIPTRRTKVPCWSRMAS